MRKFILTFVMLALGVAFVAGLVPALAGGLNTYDGISYVTLYAGPTSFIATGSAITSPVTTPTYGVPVAVYKGQATLIYSQVSEGAAGTNKVAIWESATTNGTYTFVASNVVGGVTATTTAAKLDMEGRKQFFRVRVTQSGASGGAGSVTLATY